MAASINRKRPDRVHLQRYWNSNNDAGLGMKHTLTIDGEKRNLEIRAMDESFIMYDKLWKAPLRWKGLPSPEPGTIQHTIKEFVANLCRSAWSHFLVCQFLTFFVFLLCFGLAASRLCGKALSFRNHFVRPFFVRVCIHLKHMF